MRWSMLMMIAALSLTPTALQAQTPAVDAAISTGAVGERFDGFLGFVVEPNATLRAQTNSINIKRRTLYARLAAEKGATVQDVGITAGCTLLARVPVGGAYLLSDGTWRRRTAGSPTPLPDYCR